MNAETVITCHANADNDALAALVGALVLYPDAVLLFPGSQERQVQEFYDEVVEPLYPCVSQRELDAAQVKRLVVVDTHLASRLPQVKKLLERDDLDIHVWDHHPLSDDEGDDRLPAALMMDDKVGAVSTFIVEEIRRRRLDVTCEIATSLAGGIYGDTGSFVYSSTTTRDFDAASWLLSRGADLAVVSRLITRVMGREQLKALSSMLENTQARDIGGGVVMAISSMQTETFLEDFATLAPRIMEIEDCSVIFAIASMEDKVQVVGRSRTPLVDVGEICRRLGGGGHYYAASASVKDMTLPQVRDFLKMQASLIVNADENAGKLMTSPALGASERLTIGEAQALMIRYGLKAVPIFADGTQRCIGLLAQETAAKASSHGLAHIKVSMYMQRSFSVVPETAGIQELVDIMVGCQQRLIPVVGGGDVQGMDEEEREAVLVTRPVVGVVTRTDIIRLFMGENGAHIPPVSRKARKERNLTSVMRKRLSAPCLDFLRMAGEIGHDVGASVYVVGGFVRDLVMDGKGLKWPDIDIDLVIEGDAMAFAHNLAIRLKGRVREHREFMTAMLVFPAESLCADVERHRRTHLADSTEIKVDIATARLEFYTEPGALPQVERGSIKMDLYRRDFSINAMAVRLNPQVFGQLVDFFDGQEDIRNKRIRTLHALSFVEDPTRMFRAVRFEQRYGFRMGAQCERFMRNAIDDLHLIHHLSGSRICHELELMMEERNPYLGFRRMDELGLLAEVHPLLAMNDEKRDMADRVRRVLEWYMRMYLPEEPDLLMLMLIALCRRAPAPDVESLLDRLQFSDRRKRETMQVRSSIMAARSGMNQWEKKKGSLSDLHRMLGRAPLETLLYLLAQEDNPEQHEKLTRYIYMGRQMKPDVNGDDLKRLGVQPGPMIGRILNDVLTAKMDDESMSREDQLALAARLAVQYLTEEAEAARAAAEK